MKVCLTHVKTYKKAPAYSAKQAFIKTLVKCGMPEDLADKLLIDNCVIWQDSDVDSTTVYAAEIIDDEMEFEKE